MSQPQVVMYSTATCPFCMRAKQLFENKKVKFEDIRIDQEPARRAEMMEKSGRRTVPQIWIGETHVGGSDELAALERSGKLDGMLGIK